MGCIASKNTVSITPAFDNSSSLQDQGRTSFSSHWSRSKSGDADRTRKTGGLGRNGVSEESVKGSTNGNGSLSFRLSNLHRYIEGEQVAAGWPFWLSAVAGEAIHGWVPLKSDSFEKLEKIGQGTYSCVFRARNVDTGKIVALKKVRFDNFEPESVRFMAREIQILRRLDHPNIVKLEGLITSRLSSSIYLVFEYMEHDLAGMVAFPEIKFSESQVKCYMHQLLLGLEHCHSHGVIHRDIKGANLLVNNEGILKIADFGLANFYSPGQRKPLTSRVVTLWYRPPELLLGSTNYVASVDLWSVGCVFAELLFGKPILQGRTEVEQLHKIFKLCGSPPEEYWRKSKLPHATIFKPQHRYEGSLRQICRDLPVTAIGLIETFLSVEPYKRGTALSALKSEYFMTKPYACDPSSLPVYPPSKEIDAKIREESHRKGVSSKGRAMGAARRPRTLKLEPSEGSGLYTGTKESGYSHRFENNHIIKQGLPNRDGKTRLPVEQQPMAEVNSRDEDLCINQISPRDIPFSGPLEVSTSSGFAWAKRRGGDNTSLRSNGRPSLKLRTSSMLDPMYPPHARNTLVDPVSQQGHEPSKDQEFISNGSKSYQTTKRALLKQWTQLGRPESFDASGVFHSQDFSEAYYLKDEMPSTRSTLKNEAYHADGEDKVEFSGPLLCQSHKVDELLEKHERHIRQAMRRSLFHRERKYGK